MIYNNGSIHLLQQTLIISDIFYLEGKITRKSEISIYFSFKYAFITQVSNLGFKAYQWIKYIRVYQVSEIR